LVWQQTVLVAIILVVAYISAYTAATIHLVVVAVEQVLQDVGRFDEISRMVVVHQEVGCECGDRLLLLFESNQLLIGRLIAVASVNTVGEMVFKRLKGFNTQIE
jgi:hypothetical protein